MTMRSWIRKLFTRPVTHTIRKAPRRVRLSLEALEDRCCPSTFTVTNTLDDGSVGSLGWAVGQANTTAGADAIVFDSTAFSTAKTITLTGTQLELSNTTGLETITGPAAGVTISGNNLSRVFQVDTGVTAAFSGLTITGGGKVADGGGLWNAGTLTLTNCTFFANHASSSTSGASTSSSGGAIYSSADVTAIDCTFSGNYAAATVSSTSRNTYAHAYGGAIYSSADVTVTDCAFTGNYASASATSSGDMYGVGTGMGSAYGGAIYSGAAVAATNCAFSANHADGSGSSVGGTFALGQGNAFGGAVYSGGKATVSLCVFSANYADGSGHSFGAEYGYAHGGAIDSAGDVTANYCVFSGNYASGTGDDFAYEGTDGEGYAFGGAIYCGGAASATDCTFSANYAKGLGIGWLLFFNNFQGTGIGEASGGAVDGSGQVTASNCLFSANYAEGFGELETVGFTTYAGSGFASGGAIDNSAQVTATNCQFSTNYVTGNNESGGAISSAGLTASNCVFSANTAGGGRGGAVTSSAQVTVTACTFSANTAGSSGAIGCSAQVTATNCLFSVNYVTGSSPTGGAISGAGVTVTDCTFAGNYASGSASNLDPNTGDAGSSADGGAIYSPNQLVTATNCTFSGNYANAQAQGYLYGKAYADGGAIDGVVVADNCTFSANYADASGTATASYYTYGGDFGWARGGAIYGPAMSVINCTFSANYANGSANGLSQSGGVMAIGFGGAIFSSSVAATNCTFDGNYASAESTGDFHIQIIYGIIDFGTVSFACGGAISGDSPDSGTYGTLGSPSLTGTLVNCLFASNSTTASVPSSSNSTDRGGAVSLGAATLDSCLFFGNSASVNPDYYATTVVASNIVTGDPVLGALNYNGGLTQTIALGAGSAALNAGVATTLAPPSGVTVSLSATAGSLTTGQTYYYEVTAVDSIGETTPSAEVSITLSGTTTSALISWSAVSGPVTGYNIYRSTTSGQELLIGTVAAGTTQFTDTGAATPGGPPPASNTTTLTTDQRGLPRDTPPDIGVFELQDPEVQTQPPGPVGAQLQLQRVYVINTTSDALFAGPGLLSLREAVLLANIDQVASVITFDPTVFATPQTITETDQLGLGFSASSSVGSGTVYFYQVVAETVDGTVASSELGAAGDTATLTWNAVPGAYAYQIYRRANGLGYGFLATVDAPTLTYTDANGSTSGDTGLPSAWLNLSDTTSLDTIIGPAAGVTLNAAGLGQAFQVDAGVKNASISGLTITGATRSTDLRGPVVGVGSALTIQQNAAVTLTDSTLYGNSGPTVLDNGTATVTNCTVTGSSAAGISVGTYGTAGLTNCTISGNTKLGIVAQSGSVVTLLNTIVAGNNSGGADVSGTFNSLGNNLIGKTDGSSGWIAAPASNADLTGTIANPLDPKLDPLGLQNNGGPTRTIALLPASPAIDAGAVVALPPPSNVSLAVSSQLPSPTITFITTEAYATNTLAGTLPDNTTFYYCVGAVNQRGETLASTEASITTGTIPSHPNINIVTLVWSSVPGATGYKVYRGTQSGTEQLIVTTSSTAYIDYGTSNPSGALPTVNTTGAGLLPANTTFSYSVSALNQHGETLASTVQIATGNQPDSAITVSWSAVPGATGYKIYRLWGTEQLIATVGAGTLSSTDDGSITPSVALPTANTALTLFTDQRGVSRFASGPLDMDIGAFEYGPFTPTITTSQQPPTATVGSSIADQATVSGDNATGTVTFDLYDNSNGTGTPLFTDTETLSGGSATSAGYTATATGTDYWVVTYNGDNNNNSVTSGLASEPVTITAVLATPTISTTQQPATATVGSSIADQATVSGGSNPTGTVTFDLYNNSNGTGPALFTDTENLVNGVATSAGYTATAAGTDYWVATYNGDSNNNSVTSGTNSEPVTIGQAGSTVTVTWTDGTSTTYDGNQHSAIASWSSTGTDNAGGALTVTYVGINGTNYTSSTTAPTNAGDYEASASFAGDSNHTGSTGSADFSIAKANQTITVTTAAPGSAVYNSTFNVAATADSGLAVGIAASNGASGSGSGSATVTMTSGTTAGTVTFSQAGDDNYNAATAVIETVTAQKADQTITVTTAAPGSAVYNSTFNVAASADSGLAVSIAANDGASGSGSGTATLTQISGTTAGTVTFSQAGNANYNAATAIVETVGAQKANQSITVTTAAPGSAVYNSTFNVAATASSGLTVGIAASNGASGSGSGSATLTQISGTTAGTVTFSQAGDANYNPATAVVETVTAQKANQSITVTQAAPGSAVYNSIFNVAATASSGLTVGIAASNGASGSGSGSATVTMTSGTTAGTVTFSQAGDDNYNAATAVVETVTAQKANQSITVTQAAPGSAVYNSTFNVAATASSGLPVAIAASGGASGSGSGSATVTMTSGTTAGTVTFSQAGNANYNAATAIVETVSAQKANQSITVTTAAPGSAVYNSTFNVAATADSGLPVAIAASGGASGSGSGSATVTMTSGTTAGTVTFSQAGNANYNAATAIVETVGAQKANQSITVTTAAPGSAVYNSTFNVAASASSGLTVGIAASNGASGSGSGSATLTQISGTTAGTVTFSQAGDANYNPATAVVETVTAQKANQSITVTTAAPGSAVYNSTFNVAATASSGLAVGIAASGGASGSGSGTATLTQISGTTAGTVTFSQAGDANYNPATAVVETVTAQKANQSITVTQAAPGSAVYNSTFNVAATASSGLPVAIAASGAASGSGSGSATITINMAGSTGTITFSQTGNTNYNAATAVTETVVTTQTSPTLSATAGPTVVLGTATPLTVSAKLAGSVNAGGTLTFTLYNPSNVKVYTDVVTVTGNATYNTSTGTSTGSAMPTVAGTYQWVVSYSGDGNNKGVSTTQGNTPESAAGPGATAVGNALYLVGGSMTNDQVTITPIGTSTTGSKGIQVSGALNGKNISKSYSQAFTTIYVVGFNGNETIQMASSLTIATVVSLGNGNDNVTLGNGNNTVTLGNGNDNVTLGDGNNVMVEGNGNDKVTAGNGNNLIVGGLGQHTIQAGNGSNILIDGSVSLTRSGDSLQKVLNDWTLYGQARANVADIRSRLAVTDNTSYANKLTAGSGLDWFWETYAGDSTNRKATDLLN